MNKISFIIFNIFDWVMNRLEKIGGAKLLILFAIFFSTFFSNINFAKADTTDFDNTAYTVQRSTVSGTNWIQKMYNGKNNVSKIDLKFAGKNPEMTVVFYICSGDPSGNVNNDFNCNAGTSTILWESGSVTIASSTDNYTLTLPTPVGTTGNWYLSIAHPTFPIYMQIIVSNYSSCGVVGIGSEITLNGYPGNPGCSPFYFRTYLYRKTYYSNTILTDLSVTLLTPENNAKAGLYSPTFRGFYRDDGHLASDIVLVINNLTTGGSSTKAFSLASTTHSSTTKSFGTILDDVATPMGYSEKGTSTWTAYLKAGSVQISVAPRVNTFVIGDPAPIVTLSTTSVCKNDDLDSISGQFTCALKMAFAWLVYPSQDSIDSLKTSGQEIKESFPFTVYFQLTDTVSETISSTTLNTNGSIGIPMINKQGDIYVAPILSSSSLPNAVGATNANLIRNTISWLIWLALALLLFFEIKNL